MKYLSVGTYFLSYLSREISAKRNICQQTNCVNAKRSLEIAFMYLLIVLFPLFGSIFAGIFGRFLGSRGAACVSTSCVLLSTLCSCVAFYECGLCGSTLSLEYSSWFSSEMFDASWGFYFDSLTVVMLLVVNIVSTGVHVYSISYMWGDAHIPRFMSYLSIFTFFMLMLVSADNFLQLFFGWEGVGLASYLLINFWFTRLQASKASIKAMLMNRIGDFGLALGIMCIFSQFKSVAFAPVFSCAAQKADQSMILFNCEFHTCSCICILLFIGAVGKSAQLGLHTWLPDAMEGPTPVSALIHAATMVTAGVFLLARCSPLFEFAPGALQCVAVLGGMTCFFAATTGVLQNDLKRVIAYSTCSQLGYMVFACGISNYAVGVFHLMNHAFFKALLFLSAGGVIHALSNEQDMRKMGGCVKLLPFTYSMMLIGSLSLVGFPFLTGFYSKDVILELSAARYTLSADFVYIIGVCCVFFTAYYSFRLLFCTFLVNNNAFKQNITAAHDSNLLMSIPLCILAIGSLFLGYLGKEMMIGCGSDFWGSALFTAPERINMLESEYIPQLEKMYPLIFTVIGALCALVVNCTHRKIAYNIKMHSWGRNLYLFFNKRWFFDLLYNSLARKLMFFAYAVTFKALDKGSFEMVGPFGISRTFQRLSHQLSALQSGFIYHYAVIMLCGLTALITGVVMWDFLEFFIDARLLFLLFTSFLFFNFSNSSQNVP